MTPESRILAQCIHALAPIGASLIDCATHLAGMHELLPQRGELNLESARLVAIIARIDQRYNDANDALIAAITRLEHDRLVPTPQPLAHELESPPLQARMQATRSDVCASAIGNAREGVTA